MVITVQYIIPYFSIVDGEKNRLLPVEELTDIIYPLDSALIFSGADGESKSLVEVGNLSLTDGNKSLMEQVKSLEFYERELLISFASEDRNKIIRILENVQTSSLYLDVIHQPVDNKNSPHPI